MTQARAAKEAAMRSMPPMKIEKEEFQDGHAWLARECRKSPIDVDTDRASLEWTNWNVKKEPLPKFANLPSGHQAISPQESHLVGFAIAGEDSQKILLRFHDLRQCYFIYNCPGSPGAKPGACGARPTRRGGC